MNATPARNNADGEELRRSEQSFGPSRSMPSDRAPPTMSGKASNAVNVTRVLFVMFLLLSGGALAWATYYYLNQSTTSTFDQQWASCAENAINGTSQNAYVMLASVASMASLIPVVAVNKTGTTLPFVTVPYFEHYGMKARALSNISSIVFAPVIFNATQRNEWETYSVANMGWVYDAYSYYPTGTYNDSSQSVRTDIWDSRGVAADTAGPYLPSWQMSPPPADASTTINFNYASLAGFYRMMQQVVNSQAPVLSEPANFTSIQAFGATNPSSGGNSSILLFPVLSTLDWNASVAASVVGIMLAVIPWVSFLTGVLPTGQNGVVVVVESCGSNTSYLLNGPTATALGWGDWHDPKYSNSVYQAPLLSSFGNYSSFSVLESLPDFYSCEHTLRVFPTDATVSSLSSPDAYSGNGAGSSSASNDNIDVILTSVVASVFAFAAIVFLVYDRLLRRGPRIINPEKEVQREALSPSTLPILPPENEPDTAKEEEEKNSMESKILALVQYNSETLADLLRQIVGSRNLQRQGRKSTRRTFESQTTVEAVGGTIGNGGLVLEEAVDSIDFPAPVSAAPAAASTSSRRMSRQRSKENLAQLDPEVVDQLYMFMTIIAGLYRSENAFHNFEHASQVSLTLCKMLSQIASAVSSQPPESSASRESPPKPAGRASLSRRSSSGSEDSPDATDSRQASVAARGSSVTISSNGAESDDGVAGPALSVNKPSDVEEGLSDDGIDAPAANTMEFAKLLVENPLVKFAMVLAALAHDLDHRGVPNDVLCNEEPTLADAYGRRGVHEQNALELCWSVLFSEGLEDLRAALFADVSDLQLFRQVLVNCVMSTDIFDPDLQALREKRFRRAFGNGNAGDEGADRRKATVAMEIMMQAADLAPTIQPWYLYTKWNERLYREMRDAYRARRTFLDPSTTWYQDEIVFLDTYSIPLAAKLKDCGAFEPAKADEYVRYAEENRRQWVAGGRDIVARYADADAYSPGDGSLSSGEKGRQPSGITRTSERTSMPTARGSFDDGRSVSTASFDGDRQRSVRINNV